MIRTVIRTKGRGHAPLSMLAVTGLILVVSCSEGTERSPAGGEVPTVDVIPEPELEIGAAATDGYTFTHVAGARFLSNGDILVGNRANPPRLFRLDRAGHHVWSAGREGQGPGEFFRIFRFFLVPGDTIIVDDRSQGRLSLISGDGTHLRTVTVDRYPDPRGLAALAQIDALSTGEFVAVHNYWTERGDTVAGRVMSPLMRVSASGAILDDSVTAVPSYHALASRPTRTLFGGRRVVRTDRGQVVVGQASFRVDLMDPDGTLRSSFSWPYPRRPVTEEMIEAQKVADLANMPTELPETGPLSLAERQRMVEDRYADVAYPEYLPAIHRVIPDLPRTLWVQHYPAPTDSTLLWSVFDGAGALIGEAHLPTSFHMTDVQDDLVLGVWTDVLEVQSVRTYRVVYPGPPTHPRAGVPGSRRVVSVKARGSG